ncbi:Cox family DNA-binding protein [Sodalis sp.]|uniref:Cox family DNA-binding protein n=1 Tax=Sodalis sp. (in: enterobacteria) TaxID=1898979 RepID=UPI0038736641
MQPTLSAEALISAITEQLTDHDELDGEAVDIVAEIEEDDKESQLDQSVGKARKKKKEVTYDGPISALVTVALFALYVGYTAAAVRKMCQRGMLPAHQMKQPDKPNGKGTWYINRARWDKLAEILPDLEPPEWHSWEDYWMYDRGTKRLKLKDDSSKQRCRKAAHRRSKLEIMMQEAAANG